MERMSFMAGETRRCQAHLAGAGRPSIGRMEKCEPRKDHAARN